MSKPRPALRWCGQWKSALEALFSILSLQKLYPLIELGAQEVAIERR